MGDFIGHILGGSVFLIVGLLHAVDTFLRYFKYAHLQIMRHSINISETKIVKIFPIRSKRFPKAYSPYRSQCYLSMTVWGGALPIVNVHLGKVS